MARENFSIGAFYNITKNQANPIKTVGRVVTQAAPMGRTAPILGTQLDPDSPVLRGRK